MTKLFVTLTAPIVLFLLTANPQTGNPCITNDDIIELADHKFSQCILLAKIDKSKCCFEISTSALKQLKSHNVPESVILKMIDVTHDDKITLDSTKKGNNKKNRVRTPHWY